MHTALLIGLGFIVGLVVMVVIINLALGSIFPDIEKNLWDTKEDTLV